MAVRMRRRWMTSARQLGGCGACGPTLHAQRMNRRRGLGDITADLIGAGLLEPEPKGPNGIEGPTPGEIIGGAITEGFPEVAPATTVPPTTVLPPTTVTPAPGVETKGPGAGMVIAGVALVLVLAGGAIMATRGRRAA